MSLLSLALLLVLMGANWLKWFTVPDEALGAIALITSILLIVEGWPALYQKFGQK